MLCVRLPAADRVFELLAKLSEVPLSYPEAGTTRGSIPDGYNVDRYATVLGQGDSQFESAKQAIREWVPLRLPWIRVFVRSEPSEGVLVAVAAHILGLWWVNARSNCAGEWAGDAP